jgi:Putative phage tail protein
MARFFTGLFGGQQQTQAPATSLRVNTSLQGVPIPLVLGGLCRVAGNLIDYFGFEYKNGPTTGGKGGIGQLFGKGQSSKEYYVSFLLALCEGPINVINAIWVNGNRYGTVEGQVATQILGPLNANNESVDFEVLYGDYAQQPWSFTEAFLLNPFGYTPSSGVNRALSYRGIAYLGFANYPLGGSPVVPNITVEVASNNINNTVIGQPDGDPSIVFSEVLTNVYFGLNFPAFRLGDLSLYKSYCAAIGFGVSPAISSSTKAAAFLNDLTGATNSAACWQDGELTIVPYGDAAVTAGAVQVTTETYVVPADPLPPNALDYPSLQVSQYATFAGDAGVTYLSGTKLVPVSIYAPTGEPDTGSPNVGEYYVDVVTGTYFFNAADVGNTVQISYDYAAQASYLPNLTPIYDFTIDDCLPNQITIGQGISDPSSPFMVVRKARDQMLNDIKVEYLDRNNQYNPVDIEIKDEASIVAFGRLRPSSIKQYHFFCLANAAQQSAALQLVRAQIARTFQWTVGRHFTLILELMAIATVTDPGQGLDRQAVRIKEIQENADFSLTITAEEFLGTVSAPLYGAEASSGFPVSYNVAPGAINTPIIFEPTDELGGGLQVWIAASGQETNVWGGCYVWAATSPDGTYSQVGEIDGASQMGVLSADLPPVAFNAAAQTIDDVNTLAVNLTESDGTLASGTVLDATALLNACYVGGEIISYETAALTAANEYDLTYLVRGAFGTESEIVDHPAGTPFAWLGSNIAKLPYDQNQIGDTVYLKFQSFNVWGGGTQNLSEIEPVAYQLTGAALASPLPTVTNPRAVYDVNTGFTEIDWDPIDDFRNPTMEVRLGTSVSSAMTLTTNAPKPFRVPGNGTFWLSWTAQPVSGLTVYSEEWVDVVIAGAVLTQNVIARFDLKARGWPGTFTVGAGVDSTLDAIRTGAGNILSDPNILSTSDILNYGGSQSGSYFPGIAAYIDIGYVANASVSIAYQPTGVPVGQNILAVANILTDADVLGSGATQFISVTPLIRTANTPGGDLYAEGDLYEAGDLYLATYADWSEFQSFTPGTYQARFLNFAMDLSTIDPGTIAYNLAFVITITIPSRVDSYALTTSSSADTAVTFEPTGAASAAPFNGGPGPGNLPAITWGIVNGQAGDDLIITALSLSAVSFKILNGGSRVVRNLTLFAEGY